MLAAGSLRRFVTERAAVPRGVSGYAAETAGPRDDETRRPLSAALPTVVSAMDADFPPFPPERETGRRPELTGRQQRIADDLGSRSLPLRGWFIQGLVFMRSRTPEGWSTSSGTSDASS